MIDCFFFWLWMVRMRAILPAWLRDGPGGLYTLPETWRDAYEYGLSPRQALDMELSIVD